MEAILEPRLVMRGGAGTPYVEGEFFVPAYQRGYRWGRDEVHQLLDDIRANANAAEAKKKAPNDYFLQPIVVLGRSPSVWELVDGQQRLTTLFLITKYIGTKLPDTQVQYRLTYETRDHSKEFLATLDPERREENVDFFHIAAAYEAIEEWFTDSTHGTPLQSAIDMHTALTKWVYVIWYEAPAGTDGNELFIRLNRDRIPLTDSELVKALVLSTSGATAIRREETATRWDSFERDLRDDQFWAFLTSSTNKPSTCIDFLFESMTPAAGHSVRPQYWTFHQVREDVEARGADAFWRDVVERHGLLTGWYQDRRLYHRVGYLIAIGVPVAELIESARSGTHRAFRSALVDKTRHRLKVSREDVSLLRYGKDNKKCSELLLLMNVETVLGSRDPSSRFSFYAYAGGGWSLEHIHAQSAQDLQTEKQRRDWLNAHAQEIRGTAWPAQAQARADAVAALIKAHLAMPAGKTDDIGFQRIADELFDIFGSPGLEPTEEDLHGLGNLALLQSNINSLLSNAVFAWKRGKILELDGEGASILPCTRNVFLKYYTAAEDQQLSIWGPQDQQPYYERLMKTLSDFLLPENPATAKAAT